MTQVLLFQVSQNLNFGETLEILLPSILENLQLSYSQFSAKSQAKVALNFFSLFVIFLTFYDVESQILIFPLSTAQKTKFLIKDFFSKCDQTRKKLHFLCSDHFNVHHGIKLKDMYKKGRKLFWTPVDTRRRFVVQRDIDVEMTLYVYRILSFL